MNKAELVSDLAAETSTTRAAAKRMVGAVFSAIADALARDEPVAIAGFGKFAVWDRAVLEDRRQGAGSGATRMKWAMALVLASAVLVEFLYAAFAEVTR